MVKILMLYKFRIKVNQKRLIDAMERLRKQVRYINEGGTIENMYPNITNGEFGIVLVHRIQPYDSSLKLFEGVIPIYHRYVPSPYIISKFTMRALDLISILDRVRIKINITFDKIYLNTFWDYVSDSIDQTYGNNLTQREAFKVMTKIINEYGILIGASTDHEEEEHLGEKYMLEKDLYNNIMETITRIKETKSKEVFDVDFRLGIDEYR